MARRHPGLRSPPPVRAGRARRRLCGLGRPAGRGDVVAFLPPVSGGATTALVTGPIDVAELERSVAATDLGAVVTFVGRARDRADDDRAVIELEYEVYPEMAASVLAEIAARGGGAVGRGGCRRSPPRRGADRRGGGGDRHRGQAPRRGLRGQSVHHRGHQAAAADLEARAICRWQRMEASGRLISLGGWGGRRRCPAASVRSRPASEGAPG